MLGSHPSVGLVVHSVPVSWGNKEPWFLVGFLPSPPLFLSLNKSSSLRIGKIMANTLLCARHLSYQQISHVNSFCKNYRCFMHTVHLFRNYKGEVKRYFGHKLGV